MTMKAVLLACGAGAAVLGWGTARADAIDGRWCDAVGHSVTIEGPRIVTPAGTQMMGRYSRHHFTFTVPPSDPGAGQVVDMALVNDETVHLRQGGDSQRPAEVWHRCRPIS